MLSELLEPELRDKEWTANDQSTGDATQEFVRRLGRVPLDFVEVDPTLVQKAASRTYSRRFRAFKRATDITGAIVIGLVTTPLLLPTAVAIKLESPGPVIYRQRRLGKDNRCFVIYKLRTMRSDAEVHGALFACEGDSRVTKLGRFMRRTRIDELPQIVNILRGEMSLVGPRPERPEHLARLEAAIPCFSARTAVRPGVTGWAQISPVGYAGSEEEMARKVEYDLYYLAFADVLLDLKILARTVAVVAGFRGQ